MIEKQYYVENICCYCSKYLTDECKCNFIKNKRVKDKWSTLKCKNYNKIGDSKKIKRDRIGFPQLIFGDYIKNYKEI